MEHDQCFQKLLLTDCHFPMEQTDLSAFEGFNTQTSWDSPKSPSTAEELKGEFWASQNAVPKIR